MLKLQFRNQNSKSICGETENKHSKNSEWSLSLEMITGLLLNFTFINGPSFILHGLSCLKAQFFFDVTLFLQLDSNYYVHLSTDCVVLCYVTRQTKHKKKVECYDSKSCLVLLC